MAGKARSYHRLYALLGNMRFGYDGQKEEFKEQIVMQATKGRTSSLREMTTGEYAKMCEGLERLQGVVPDMRDTFILMRKRCRSSALHQLQLYGVDTTDWAAVNAFCLQPRIAGH